MTEKGEIYLFLEKIVLVCPCFANNVVSLHKIKGS